MRRMILFLVGVVAAIPLASGLLATPTEGPHGNSLAEGLPKGIAFYGVLKDGLEEAKATNRPILFISAAPQCTGVPGVW